MRSPQPQTPRAVAQHRSRAVCAVVLTIVVSAIGKERSGCSREQRFLAFLGLVCILLVRDRRGIIGLVGQPDWHSLLRAIEAHALTGAPLLSSSREQRLILRFRMLRSSWQDRFSSPWKDACASRHQRRVIVVAAAPLAFPGNTARSPRYRPAWRSGTPAARSARRRVLSDWSASPHRARAVLHV